MTRADCLDGLKLVGSITCVTGAASIFVAVVTSFDIGVTISWLNRDQALVMDLYGLLLFILGGILGGIRKKIASEWRPG